ncbi:hypothetical protein HUH83_004110 [Salmonella enterica]|nr:hypothetical protein [Salmonella enterica]
MKSDCVGTLAVLRFWPESIMKGHFKPFTPQKITGNYAKFVMREGFGLSLSVSFSFSFSFIARALETLETLETLEICMTPVTGINAFCLLAKRLVRLVRLVRLTHLKSLKSLFVDTCFVQHHSVTSPCLSLSL